MTMSELAEWINLYLKMFEGDPKINKKDDRNIPRFWHSFCHYPGRGPKISVKYISFQHTSTLSKAEAEKYLEWLEAGNVGRHYEALRDR